MVILVTGATGRIGRNLVKALLDRGEQVRILVYGDEKIPFENVEVFYGDVADSEAVKKALQNVDTVYHLAAILDYTVSKDLMYKVNVIGTKNIVELSDNQKIIYLSSTAVYGNKMKENPANERTSCKPSEFYGKTKLAAEKLVLAKNGIVIRSPIVMGKEFKEGFDLIFNRLMKGKLPMLGSGKNFIHWIHINDLIQALLLAKEKGKPAEVYVVAGKEVKTLKELIGMVCKYLNVIPPEKSISTGLLKISSKYKMFKHKLGGRRPELLPEYLDKIMSNRTFDIRKAEAELGFRPKIDYEQAIKEMIEDFLKDKQDNVPIEQSNNQS